MGHLHVWAGPACNLHSDVTCFCNAQLLNIKSSSNDHFLHKLRSEVFLQQLHQSSTPHMVSLNKSALLGLEKSNNKTTSTHKAGSSERDSSTHRSPCDIQEEAHSGHTCSFSCTHQKISNCNIKLIPHQLNCNSSRHNNVDPNPHQKKQRTNVFLSSVNLGWPQMFVQVRNMSR